MPGNLHEYSDRVFDRDVYDREYFIGGAKSGYDNYAFADGILDILVDISVKSLGHKLTPRSSVLDIGAAYGHVSHSFYKRGFGPNVAAELSPWAIEQGRKLYPHVEFHEMDVTDALAWDGLPDYDYQLVTAFEFFEHVPTTDADTILEQMAKRAKWGIFLLQCYQNEDEPKDGARGDHGHLHFHSRLWWLNKLDEYADNHFDSSLKLNSAAMGVNGVFWDNRMFVVRFN